MAVDAVSSQLLVTDHVVTRVCSSANPNPKGYAEQDAIRHRASISSLWCIMLHLQQKSKILHHCGTTVLYGSPCSQHLALFNRICRLKASTAQTTTSSASTSAQSSRDLCTPELLLTHPLQSFIGVSERPSWLLASHIYRHISGCSLITKRASISLESFDWLRHTFMEVCDGVSGAADSLRTCNMMLLVAESCY